MARPCISVVMPVRNCGSWLQSAVGSILDQTLDDFELLIIDNHSYDGSIELLPQDSRIKIFRHSGTGIVTSLNVGLIKAKGEFIARMDGDDLSSPNRFQSQLNYARQNPTVGIISGLVEIFSDDSVVKEGNIHYQNWLNSILNQEDFDSEIFVESPLVHPSTFIRRDIFKKIGLYRDLSWPEDYDLWLRAWLSGVKMGKVPECIFHWRDHPQRLTRTDKRYSQKEFIKAKTWALSESLLKNRSATICGTGQYAAKFCDLLQSLSITVKGFIDISPKKIGKTRRGLPVYSLQELLVRRDDTLILGAVAARGSSNRLRKLLASYGLEELKDFVMVC